MDVKSNFFLLLKLKICLPMTLSSDTRPEERKIKNLTWTELSPTVSVALACGSTLNHGGVPGLCVYTQHPSLMAAGFRVFRWLFAYKQAQILRVPSTRCQVHTPSMERTSSIRRKTLTRQHKAEVMIAGEQLRYEPRRPRATLRSAAISNFKVVKVEASRREADQGQAPPPAHVS